MTVEEMIKNPEIYRNYMKFGDIMRRALDFHVISFQLNFTIFFCKDRKKALLTLGYML